MKAPPTRLVRPKAHDTVECPPLDYWIPLGPQLQIGRLTPGELRIAKSLANIYHGHNLLPSLTKQDDGQRFPQNLCFAFF
jgi:hypothetical protein